MTSEIRVWAATGLLFLTFIILAGVNPIIVDDMFITFQYVRNWVDHGVLTWWPGAPMVDGFTSLGHVMLLSLGRLAGMELIAANTLINLLAMVAIVAGVLRASRTLSWAPRVAGVSVVFINSGFFFWIAGGLDGIIYAALMLWTYLSFERAERTGRFGPTTAALLIAIAITRPEALFIAPAIVGFFWATHWAGRPMGPGALVLPSVVLAAVVCLVLWRLSVYGHPLPNTYYAKASASRMLELRSGLAYLWEFLSIQGGFILAATPLALVLGSGAWLRALFILGIATIAVVSGGDPHPAGRFFLPLLPLVALDVAWLLQRTRGWRFAAIVVGVVGYLGIQVELAVYKAPEQRSLAASLRDVISGRWPYQSDEANPWARVMKQTVQDLDRQLIPDAPIIGTDVGALAYFSNRWVRDAAGLNDPDLARMPKPKDETNDWGVIRIAPLAADGVSLAYPYFPTYDTWSWDQIATGQLACSAEARRRTRQVTNGMQVLHDQFSCASISSTGHEELWINLFVRKGHAEGVFRDPSQVTVSQCLPKVLAACHLPSVDQSR